MKNSLWFSEGPTHFLNGFHTLYHQLHTSVMYQVWQSLPVILAWGRGTEAGCVFENQGLSLIVL